MDYAMMGSQTTWLDRVLDNVRRGVFGTAFTVNKDLPVLKRMAVVSMPRMVIDFLQMLAFPLNGSSRFPWAGESAVAPFSKFLGIVAGDIVNDSDSVGTFQLALWLTATVWTTIFLGLCAVVAYNFVHDSGQNVLVLRALRSIATLSTTVLFLPFTTVMFRGIACTADSSEGWMGTGWVCRLPGRLVLAVFVVILLLGFAGMSLFIASVFVDRSPKSASWTAKVHGRNDVALLLMKLVIGGVYNIGSYDILGSWMVTALLILCGGAWYYLCFTRMPFIHQGINVLQGGLAGGFTWAAVALGSKQLFKETAPDRIYLGIPSLVALGAALVYIRYTIVSRRSLEECSSLHDVDIWCRAKLRKYAAVMEHRGMSSPHSRRGRRRSQLAAVEDESEDGESAALLQNEWHQEGADDASSAAGGAAASAEDADASSAEAQEESLLQEAERGYRFAMERFGQAEMSFQLAAIFFQNYWPFRYNEALALAHAKRLSPAADIRFYIYQRGRQLRETDQSGMSPLDRVLFDQYWKEVTELRVEAARKMTHLWEALADKTPDLAQLRTVGVSLQETIHRMDMLYWRMMRVNGDLTALLRAYASHLIEFSNDSHRSSELLNRADRIEDVHSKVRTNTMRHIVMGAKKRSTITASDLLQDSNAIVTISGDPTNLGEILFVSSSACRAFGYTSAQLIGQNVHVIVPHPIRRAHDMFLARFGSKQHRGIVGMTQLLFGQRRDGSIFPLWLSVIESPPDEETFQPRFTAIVQPVSTDENHVLFGTSQRQFRIYGGSSQSMDLLGLSVEDFGDPATDLSKVIPSLAPDFTGSSVQLTRDDINQLQRSPSFMQHLHSSLEGKDGAAGGKARAKRGSATPKAAVDSSLAALLGNIASEGEGATKGQGEASSQSGGDTMDPLTDILSTSGRGGQGSGAENTGASAQPDRNAHGSAQSTTVPVRPLLELRHPRIIPLQLTGPRGERQTENLFGSVQKIVIPGVSPFYLLRWNHVSANDYMFYGNEGAMGEAEGSVGGSNSVCDSGSDDDDVDAAALGGEAGWGGNDSPVPNSSAWQRRQVDRGGSPIARRGVAGSRDLTGMESMDDGSSRDDVASIPGSINDPEPVPHHSRGSKVSPGTRRPPTTTVRGFMTVRGRPKSILRAGSPTLGGSSDSHGFDGDGQRMFSSRRGQRDSAASEARIHPRGEDNDQNDNNESSSETPPAGFHVTALDKGARSAIPARLAQDLASAQGSSQAELSESSSIRSDTGLVQNVAEGSSSPDLAGATITVPPATKRGSLVNQNASNQLAESNGTGAFTVDIDGEASEASASVAGLSQRAAFHRRNGPGSVCSSNAGIDDDDRSKVGVSRSPGPNRRAAWKGDAKAWGGGGFRRASVRPMQDAGELSAGREIVAACLGSVAGCRVAPGAREEALFEGKTAA